MCPGSRGKLTTVGSVMEVVEFKKQDKISVLLELSAADDLIGFRTVVEEEGHDINESGYWYCRRIGSKKMGFEERTPLMVACMFGSKQVLSYILETGYADVNKACGSDYATALHCAVDGGSASSPHVVKLLLDAGADVDCSDANGNRPADLIAPLSNSSFNSRRKMLELMLKGYSDIEETCIFSNEQKEDQPDRLLSMTPALKDGAEKKEYPIDLSLPDIKNGVYGTDEFRMYTFKVKPCSRAYSHDWTECPFVHPGENARRRDPRKFHYSCVPCPEFRKGTCRQGDNCEYAHGIFECWLHPAQYRTRLCKDETGCSRKVCFFAHKPEELRPLYASTGSAVPSPRSFSTSSSMDMASMSQLALGSPSSMMPPISTPPVTPSGVGSSVGGGYMWPNQPSLAPPTLHLPGSRLKATLTARDMDLGSELLGLESHLRRQQYMMDELSGLSSPSWKNAGASPFTGSSDWSGELNRSGGVAPINLDDIFGSLDPTVLSQLQGLSLDAGTTKLQSSAGMQMRQNVNQQLRSSYPSSSRPSSPMRASASFGGDQASLLNSRSAAFAKRSHSFIERSDVNRHSGISSPASASMMPSALTEWGSPDGKLDWGIQKEELNKLRKSASFGLRSSGSSFTSMSTTGQESELSWVQPMSKDAPPELPGQLNFEQQQQQQNQQYHLNGGSSEMFSPWVEQLYMEQEQLVA